MNTQPSSAYLQLYQYLPVLTEEQIIKLRNVAVGILQLSAFTLEEVESLELQIRQQTSAS